MEENQASYEMLKKSPGSRRGKFGELGLI